MALMALRKLGKDGIYSKHFVMIIVGVCTELEPHETLESLKASEKSKNYCLKILKFSKNSFKYFRYKTSSQTPSFINKRFVYSRIVLLHWISR